MITKIFTIFDQKAKLYNHPFYFHNEGQAIRGFTDAINDPETQYGKHPEDYTLYRIGKYDDEKAKLTQEEPVNLGTGVEFLKTE